MPAMRLPIGSSLRRIAGAFVTVALIAACGGGGGTDPAPPDDGGGGGGGGGGGNATSRLTVVLPSLTPINAVSHSVIVLAGANPPANRAAVTSTTPRCSIDDGAVAVTCPYDIPTGQLAALVAAEPTYAPAGIRALGSRPPDNFPVEFERWDGDVAGAVETGFLRVPMDRARRIEARFRVLQPIVVVMRSAGTETVFFRVIVNSPPQLSLPPITPSPDPFNTPPYGGSTSDPVLWFFLRTGASATIEPRDDIAQGCTPGPAQQCSRFVRWEGDCTGTGVCTVTGGAAPKSIIAVTERQGGS